MLNSILENYLKSNKVKKTLKTKPGEEGFSLIELVVVIAVLAILSAVAIPAFNGVQVSARASAVKNGLVNGIKECAILESENEDTDSQDVVQSFPGNYQKYTIEEYASGTVREGTCYNAQATPENSGEGTFQIEMSSQGVVTKLCTPTTAKGCESDGTW